MDSKTRQRLIEMADGSLVEHDVLNVVDKIREYDSSLRLKYAQVANIGDPPYKLFEMCNDGVERLIMNIWELDERVIERIRAADNARGNVLLDIDLNNLNIENENHRRFREEMDEAKDMVEHYLKSSKSRYSMRDSLTGTKITIDDQHGIPAKIERE